jgi:hypothetical protein
MWVTNLFYNKFTRFTRLCLQLEGPFVTAVGGTTHVNPEVAASFSGGGFSNYFSRPSYQDDAVLSYLQKVGRRRLGLFKCVFLLALAMEILHY